MKWKKNIVNDEQWTIGFIEGVCLPFFLRQPIVPTWWCHIAVPLKGGKNCTRLLKTAVSEEEITLQTFKFI